MGPARFARWDVLKRARTFALGKVIHEEIGVWRDMGGVFVCDFAFGECGAGAGGVCGFDADFEEWDEGAGADGPQYS